MSGIRGHRTAVRCTGLHRFPAAAIFYPDFYPKRPRSQGFVKVSVTVGDRSGRRSAVLGGLAEGRPDAGLVTVRERLRCRRAGLPGAA